MTKSPAILSPFKGGQAGGAFLISSFLTHYFREENALSPVPSFHPHPPFVKGANGIPSLAR